MQGSSSPDRHYDVQSTYFPPEVPSAQDNTNPFASDNPFMNSSSGPNANDFSPDPHQTVAPVPTASGSSAPSALAFNGRPFLVEECISCMHANGHCIMIVIDGILNRMLLLHNHLCKGRVHLLRAFGDDCCLWTLQIRNCLPIMCMARLEMVCLEVGLLAQFAFRH